MKEPDVSSWSREELEAAYKQSQKNVAARGQSLAHAKKRIEELEKQIAGMEPDEVEQTIAEQAQKIEELGAEIEDLKAARERMMKTATELEHDNSLKEGICQALKRQVDSLKEAAVQASIDGSEDTIITVRGPRPQMMTVYFNGEEGEG